MGAMFCASSIDLEACGDKFLRIGRSARFRRYAAVHPSAILIYSPTAATRSGIDKLKAILKGGGHKAVAITHSASVTAALSASRYDIVMADYEDAERLKKALGSAASSPTLLPILLNENEVVEREAVRRYPFLIRPHAMTKYDALAEVDRLMASRRNLSASS